MRAIASLCHVAATHVHGWRIKIRDAVASLLEVFGLGDATGGKHKRKRQIESHVVLHILDFLDTAFRQDEALALDGAFHARPC
jgi:hypothetical protein